MIMGVKDSSVWSRQWNLGLCAACHFLVSPLVRMVALINAVDSSLHLTQFNQFCSYIVALSLSNQFHLQIAFRFLFPLDFRRPLSTLWVCVEACPGQMLMSHGEIERQVSYPLCLNDNDNLTLIVEFLETLVELNKARRFFV